MTLLHVFFAIQLLTIDKAIETAQKDPKPVVLCLHEGAGGDIAKSLEEMFGEQAAKFHFAVRDCKADADAARTQYGVKNLDGAILFLDPGLEEKPDRVLARFEKESKEAIDKLAAKALEVFADREACRAALRKMWKAFQDNDANAATSVMLPFHDSGATEEQTASVMREGKEAATKRPGLRFKSIAVKAETKDETVFTVKFDMVDKDGKGDGTSFEVKKRKDGFFVVYGR
ncbi:MAG: hypothetical protein K8T20_07590 [Planctomycetes bacterium]|nr:hypothetical protein [Planctomycetota bacterium]